MSTAVTGIAEPGQDRCGCGGASDGPGAGRRQHSAAKASRPATSAARRRRRQLQAAARRRRPAAPPGAPSRLRRDDQQHAGDAAADRGLGQRDVGRVKADPDERQQQPVGEIADHGGEQLAGGDGPGGDRRGRERRGRDRAPCSTLISRPSPQRARR